MILVLLGTFNIEFARPIIAIEKAVMNGWVKGEIIVQTGYTNYNSDLLNIRPFIEPNELDRLYDEADFIITHSGTGSIIKALKKGKKVIAIPRLHKFNEHIDDHQLEILQIFTNKNYIIPWNESDNLEVLLQQIKSFVPAVYSSDNKKIVDFLIEYIDSI